MQEAERKRFSLLVDALAANFGRDADAGLLEGYWRALEDLPIGAVEQAVNSALRQCKHMPRGVELRELAGEMTISARAALAWGAVQRSLAHHGAYASVNFDDPVVNATVRNLGGWQRICSLPSEENDKWTRKEFERIYVALCSAGVTNEQAQHLVGIHETNNTGLGLEPRITHVATGLPPQREGIMRIGPVSRPGLTRLSESFDVTALIEKASA